jgi:hypothetical protein
MAAAGPPRVSAAPGGHTHMRATLIAVGAAALPAPGTNAFAAPAAPGVDQIGAFGQLPQEPTGHECTAARRETAP